MTPDSIRVGKRFFRAAKWSAELHAASCRAGGPRTPSVAQVLGVASLVMEDGGTEREAIAAMLHDAIQGHRVATDELADRFGKKVARLVEACSLEEPADDSTNPRERMQRYLDRLEQTDDPSVLRVCAAERLRDARAVVLEMRRNGSVAFARFNAPPTDVLWYYQALVGVLRFRMPRSQLFHELRNAVGEIERDLELDTATAAWRVAHADAA
jgi:(p)ppGpp synthase/HD superfamily hydrolase